MDRETRRRIDAMTNRQPSGHAIDRYSIPHFRHSNSGWFDDPAAEFALPPEVELFGIISAAVQIGAMDRPAAKLAEHFI